MNFCLTEQLLAFLLDESSSQHFCNLTIQLKMYFFENGKFFPLTKECLMTRICKDRQQTIIPFYVQDLHSVTRLLSQYFAYFKCINFVAKVGSKFCQIRNNHSQNCQKLLNFAKVAKIHQNWSHWIFRQILTVIYRSVVNLINILRL